MEEKISVGEELRSAGVTDNPFDVIMATVIELTRGLMFACRRYRNPEISQDFCISKEEIMSCIADISSEYIKLESLSDEAVSLCRETAFFSDGERSTEFNDFLFKIEEQLQTVKTVTVPIYPEKFLKAVIGTESQEFENILKLRSLTENEFKHYDKNYLSDLAEIAYAFEEDERDNIGDKLSEIEKYIRDFDNKLDLVKKYKLTVWDVEYMMAYKFRKVKSSLEEAEA